MSEDIYVCPRCNEKFKLDQKILGDVLSEQVSLSGEDKHYMDNLEELRLTLKSFMKPSVLTTINDLFGFLDKKPRTTEQYAWFLRNSQFGGDCKFALAALKLFKRDRIDRVKELLKLCLSELENISKE